MASFSKYLGKDERVLNAIDMKDETMWASNNIAAAEYKSWTTLVITNKRLFSLNKRKLNMREFRLEDIVSTGWTYHPQWGKLIWGFLYLIAAVLIYIKAEAIGYNVVYYVTRFLTIEYSPEAASFLTQGATYAAVLLVLMAAISFFSYYLLKRTTLRMSTRDGKEYTFLLRGRRVQIDDFRMAVQDARDLYIEETENRYFDKMRTVLFDQSRYEYALNNARVSGTPIEEPKTEKLEREEYLLWERKNAKLNNAPERKQIGGMPDNLLPETSMRLNPDGTLQLEAGGAYQLTDDGHFLLDESGNYLLNSKEKYLLNPDGTYQLNPDGTRRLNPDVLNELSAESVQTLKSSAELNNDSLFVKAADLFEQMGFETSKLNDGIADLLLYKDNIRYVVVIDEEGYAITNDQIQKAIRAKNHYKTDLGLFISAGDLTDEIQEYANKNGVKIVYIKKAE